ncbi:ABC transporter permease [Acidisphaera rubrifaciens]|uniref:ABC transporter domain-containing protein n=1 Tax=Acidisphaera rubrifaciens HS-AP3 TaxID=1231350 RepID=A0A0D6P4W8_9PROT|nr:ABC transporter permease [Acidisphaera rubrifaciens]GAN76805.1 hypothetical protein Asru_0165_13 [Acidisphaera rubrifaciens HS-AP3]
MAERSAARPLLQVRDLHVYYGAGHVIQGIDLTLPSGILSIVGRNGMGKTTLCNAITGLKAPHAGSIMLDGRELAGQEPHAIARAGVGYVPQGRRVWRSLSVDEHLRLAARGGRDAAWTVERVYQAFPRLAERRGNGGAQLSGGEQQMLAIGRALLGNPRLLVMDEPTEGLAPVIVEQVEHMLTRLADEGEIGVLLIEQNIGVATEVADTVAIMVNGRIERTLPACTLAADRDLQQRLLGVGRHGEAPEPPPPAAEAAAGPPVYFRVSRGGGSGPDGAPTFRTVTTLPNRWSAAHVASTTNTTAGETAPRAEDVTRIPALAPMPQGRTALIVGTFDTKGRELRFLRDTIRDLGLRTRTVDLSTSGRPSSADVTPQDVASLHPRGSGAVFGTDRGASVAAMAAAFERWIVRQRDIGGVISAGGSGGTSLATAGMRRLPIGMPKVMISTVASGDVGRYVGPVDIMMMYAVADIQGLNPITETILRNGANALAGMIARAPAAANGLSSRMAARPSLGLTMFGVTTPCVQALTTQLDSEYDCLVFHATGTGGRSMEALVQSGMLAAVLDITTTEIADLLVGGVFAATEERLEVFARTPLPYVGSCGALDMVNFGARDTVPDRFRDRRFVEHNANVTLMRTTASECAAIGRWIAERLNRMAGPVRFLLPEGGVSMLDSPGQPFHDPAADRALFDAIEAAFIPTPQRRLIRVPANINDAAFVAAVLAAFHDVVTPMRKRA